MRKSSLVNIKPVGYTPFQELPCNSRGARKLFNNHKLVFSSLPTPNGPFSRDTLQTLELIKIESFI